MRHFFAKVPGESALYPIGAANFMDAKIALKNILKVYRLPVGTRVWEQKI